MHASRALHARQAFARATRFDLTCLQEQEIERKILWRI